MPDPVKGHFYWTSRRAHPCARCATSTSARERPVGKASSSGGVYHIHKNLGVNESVMWGEYFFVEALDNALA